MIPFLVRVRIPAARDRREAIAMYVAMFDTEPAARKAVEDAVPADWQVEGVVGQLEQMGIERHNLKPGDVQPLAGRTTSPFA